MSYLPFIVINAIILLLVIYVATGALADYREHQERIKSRERSEQNRW